MVVGCPAKKLQATHTKNKRGHYCELSTCKDSLAFSAQITQSFTIGFVLSSASCIKIFTVE